MFFRAERPAARQPARSGPMTGKTAPKPGNESTDARPRRGQSPAPAGPAARSEGPALIQGLDRLRDALIRRLEQIETLALEQGQLLEEDASERERALRERVSVLEAAHARHQAE